MPDRDLEIPENTGPIVLADPYSKQEILINPREVSEGYAQRSKRAYDELRQTFKELKIDHLTLMTDEDFVTKITHFFMKRERRKKG